MAEQLRWPWRPGQAVEVRYDIVLNDRHGVMPEYAPVPTSRSPQRAVPLMSQRLLQDNRQAKRAQQTTACRGAGGAPPTTNGNVHARARHGDANIQWEPA